MLIIPKSQGIEQDIQAALKLKSQRSLAKLCLQDTPLQLVCFKQWINEWYRGAVGDVNSESDTIRSGNLVLRFYRFGPTDQWRDTMTQAERSCVFSTKITYYTDHSEELQDPATQKVLDLSTTSNQADPPRSLDPGLYQLGQAFPSFDFIMLREIEGKEEKVAFQIRTESIQRLIKLSHFLTALRGYIFRGDTIATLPGWKFVVMFPKSINRIGVDVSFSTRDCPKQNRIRSLL